MDRTVFPTLPTPSRRRTFAAAVALVALAAGVVAVVIGQTGPGEVPVALPAAQPVVQGGDEGVAPILEDGAPTFVATTHGLELSRDPFLPVVPEEPASTPTTDGSTTVNPDDPGSSPVTPPPDRQPGEPSCTGREELVCDGRVLTLLGTTGSIDGLPAATIQVDTTAYEAVAGDTFAGVFTLWSIGEGCVTIRYSGEEHRLCIANTTTK